MSEVKVDVKVTPLGSVLMVMLTALFATLKLTGYLAWSWWAVTSPLWVPAAAALVAVFLVVLAFLIALVVGSLWRSWSAGRVMSSYAAASWPARRAGAAGGW